MEPSSIVITFLTMNGVLVPPDKASITFTAGTRDTKHLVGTFEPHSVRSISVGKNMTLYGHVLKEVNGQNVRQYIHLREGSYQYKLPFQFLSMHMDYVPTQL